MTQQQQLPRETLTDIIFTHTRCTKQVAKETLRAVLAEIAGAIAAGKAVRLIELGTFERRDTKASRGRNPRTGEPIDIEAGYRATFRSGEALKTQLAIRFASDAPAEAAE